MKMATLVKIASSVFMVIALGCATSDTEKYVGTWRGGSAKAKDGVLFKLDEGGGGYAMTYVGAVPLKWREKDATRLDVRFSCGDGFLSSYDLVYSPGDKTLRLMSQKSIRLKDGKVSKERVYEEMVLSRSNEYSKAMVQAIEYAEKAREIHAKSDRKRRQ